MRDIKQISDGDRLFYEMGRKINTDKMSYDNNWIRGGQFIEVEDVKNMLENDKYMTNIEYLEHHNFMIIKKN